MKTLEATSKSKKTSRAVANNLENSASNYFYAAEIQTKLTIGKPNDKYEQEADRVADQVMRMPDPEVQRQCTNCKDEDQIQTKTSSDNITPWIQKQEEEEEEPVQMKSLLQTQPIEEEEEIQTKSLIQTQPVEEEEEMLQPKTENGQNSKQNVFSEAELHASECGGQSLSSSTRSFFEPHFSSDFSNVKVHTCDNAVQMNRNLNARAFTHGNNIFFNHGQFNPGTSSGKHLLAHELTHVVQQRHAPMIQRFIFGNDDAPTLLPAGTISHRGAAENARWLQGHRNSGNPVSEGISYVFVSSSISSETTQDITNRCNQNGGFLDRLLCLHDQVHAEVQILEARDGDPGDQDYVCRNYAATAHDVAQQMGLSPDWETSTTHAWVEFTDNGRQYVLDAYNEIMFSYPT